MLWSFIMTGGAFAIANNASQAGLNRLAIFMMVVCAVSILAMLLGLYYLKRTKR
jgi:uncharacterized membrane protein